MLNGNNYVEMEKLVEGLCRPLQTLHGWIGVIFTFLTTYLMGVRDYIIFIVIAVALDAIFGVIVSVTKKGKFFESGRLRDSIIKLFFYLCVILLILFIDVISGNDSYIAIRIVAPIIIFCEIWSILTSYVILQPKSIAAKLLKRFMVGEIAKKLGKTEEEIKETIEGGTENGNKE